MLIDDYAQHQLGFTDHALERFAQRAGLNARSRAAVEPVIRDLLNQEGRFVAEPPHWARSQNRADGYVQVGDWLLLICRFDELRAGGLTVVTIVNGPEGTTWQRALELGYIATPLPQRFPAPPRPFVSIWESVLAGRRSGPGADGGGLFSRILAAHRAQRAKAQAEHQRAVSLHRQRVEAYEDARARARTDHRRRNG
jgi:hypothetical protein